jgi:hypothetical protein
MNQTAVQWLRDRLKEQIPEQYDIISFWLLMAEKEEKQQIIDAVDGHPLPFRHLEGEDYYEATYGKTQDE